MRRRLAFVALATALVASACGRTERVIDIGPSPVVPAPVPAPPPIPPTPVVVSVSVSAEKTDLRVGEGVQASAKALYSDGAEKSVPAEEVEWTASTTGVVEVSPSGWVSARAAGNCRVVAEFEGKTGELAFSVVAPPPVPAPSPPAPTPTPSPSGPDGNWVGQTAQGTVVKFTVSNKTVTRIEFVRCGAVEGGNLPTPAPVFVEHGELGFGFFFPSADGGRTFVGGTIVSSTATGKLHWYPGPRSCILPGPTPWTAQRTP